MAEILRSLGQLFVQSTPTVMFVFALLLVLERWFFRPLTATIRQRQEETVGALARARELAAQAEAKAREYQAALQAARQELYRLREADRRAALSERENALARARQEAESRVKRAQVELTKQAEAVRQELERASHFLAGAIVDAILGGCLPAGDKREVRS
jgi:F-type H+-transporting ATPase subunit b